MDGHSHWSGYFISWLRQISFKYDTGKAYLDFCLDELINQKKHTAAITRKLRKHCKEHGLIDQVNLLRSVVGVGFIFALTLLTEVVDIHRFPTLDHLASYFGLIPSVRSSGEKSSDRGLTRRRNRYLRTMIVESAWVAIRKDPALLMTYQRLTKRMKSQDAIIRIARKLLNRIRYVWKNQERYVIAVVE
jgi:transposase